MAETQWGLMLCIFAASHVPALLWLEIPGFEGKEILLIAWLVIVVQAGRHGAFHHAAADGAHADRARRAAFAQLGRVHRARSAPASCVGTALAWITPFAPWQAAIMALAVSLLGYAGGMVMAAIKRDKGVDDWGHLIPGQGGFIDRLDSVVFSAPLFFHLVRFFCDSGVRPGRRATGRRRAAGACRRGRLRRRGARSAPEPGVAPCAGAGRARRAERKAIDVGCGRCRGLRRVRVEGLVENRDDVVGVLLSRVPSDASALRRPWRALSRKVTVAIILVLLGSHAPRYSRRLDLDQAAVP